MILYFFHNKYSTVKNRKRIGNTMTFTCKLFIFYIMIFYIMY